jgi:hypothetical protein
MIVCEDCRKTTSGKCWRHGQITPPTSSCDEILPCLIHRTEAADLPDRAVQPPTDTDTALRTADALWSALYDRLEPEERIGYGRLYEQMYSWMLARAASQERPQPDLWDDIYGEDGTAAQLSAPPEQMSEADRRILETSRSGVAQERPSIDVDAKRSVVNTLRDCHEVPEAGNDAVVVEDFDWYQGRLAKAGWTLACLSSPEPVESGE